MREVDVIGSLRALGGSATVYDLSKELKVSIPTVMKYLIHPIGTGEVSIIRGKRSERFIYQLKSSSRQTNLRIVETPRRVSLREVVSISIGDSVFDMTLEEARELAAELNSVISKTQFSDPPQAWSRLEIENAQMAAEPALSPNAPNIREYKAQWKRVREHLRRWAGVTLTQNQIMGVVHKYVPEATWIKAKKNLVSTNVISRREGSGWMVMNPRDRKTR